MRNPKKYLTRGFTLIELLTVVAIIAMLIAIIGAGTKKIKISQRNLQQKAMFHAGEISLELYQKDFGEYPDSSVVENGGKYVSGAQRVAESLFGRDDRGYRPGSKWHPAKDPANFYSSDSSSLSRRKTPYFERKRAGFYAIYDLWQTNSGSLRPIYSGPSAGAVGPDKTPLSPVFTDMFEQNRVVIGGETVKVGMPILYFRAEPTKTFRSSPPASVTNTSYAVYSQWTYNFEDNLPIIELPWLRELDESIDGLSKHYQKEGSPTSTTNNAQVFYELITERQDGTYFRPKNKNTYLLISAGWDGIYGTKDDLTNYMD